MNTKGYKLTTFCIYKFGKTGAIMLNCKNGAIIYIDEHLQELSEYIQHGFGYKVNNELKKLLIEKEFFIECGIDESKEAEIAYDNFYNNITDPHKYIGLTINLGHECSVVSKDNIMDIFGSFLSYLKTYSPKQILIKLIITSEYDSDVIIKEIRKIKDNISNQMELHIHIEFVNCFVKNILENMSDSIEKVIWHVEESNNDLLHNVILYPLQREIDYTLCINCKYGYTMDIEEKINFHIKYMIYRDNGNKNINSNILNELQCLDQLAKSGNVIDQFDWFKKWGLICEYALPYNFYIDNKLGVYKCFEHCEENEKVGLIQNGNIILSKCSNLNKQCCTRCLTCKCFYLCYGYSCYFSGGDECPIKTLIIDEYVTLLLDDIQKGRRYS